MRQLSPLRKNRANMSYTMEQATRSAGNLVVDGSDFYQRCMAIVALCPNCLSIDEVNDELIRLTTSVKSIVTEQGLLVPLYEVHPMECQDKYPILSQLIELTEADEVGIDSADVVREGYEGIVASYREERRRYADLHPDINRLYSQWTVGRLVLDADMCTLVERVLMTHVWVLSTIRGLQRQYAAYSSGISYMTTSATMTAREKQQAMANLSVNVDTLVAIAMAFDDMRVSCLRGRIWPLDVQREIGLFVTQMYEQKHQIRDLFVMETGTPSQKL